MLTIGVFDGVHRGHVQLISRAVQLAKQRGVPSMVMTFDPHPAEVVRPGSHPAQLTTLRRKAELIEQLGVDVLYVLPFTPEVQRMPAEQFVHELLVERLHVSAVVVGQNFTFGYKAQGDVDLLRKLGHRFGFTTEDTRLLTAGPSGDDPAGDETLTFSSTYIRACVDAGDVAAAAEALGRPHRLEGIVVRGDGRGRELGYPTANLSLSRYAAIPADGIYAGWFSRQRSSGQDCPMAAAISVGTNPTFSGRERRVEAFVLDTDTDFYGQRVNVDFVARLRDMERFDSVDDLIAQMGRDVRRTRELLGVPGA